MKKKVTLLFLFILSINLCGCLQNDNSSNESPPITDWEVIDCSRIADIINHSFTGPDNNTHYVETEGISNVSITLKNTGNVKTTYILDFEFQTREIEELIDVEHKIIWSINECPCNSISDSNNVSQTDQKTITIDPGQKAIVYSSCNPNPSYGLRVNKWFYEISIQ